MEPSQLGSNDHGRRAGEQCKSLACWSFILLMVTPGFSDAADDSGDNLVLKHVMSHLWA